MRGKKYQLNYWFSLLGQISLNFWRFIYLDEVLQSECHPQLDQEVGALQTYFLTYSRAPKSELFCVRISDRAKPNVQF